MTPCHPDPFLGAHRLGRGAMHTLDGPLTAETLGERAARLDAALRHASAEEILRTAITQEFPGRIAAVSSFGAEAAALLALVADIDPATPVLFLETGKHFAETAPYRDALAARLGLTEVRILRPRAAE